MVNGQWLMADGAESGGSDLERLTKLLFGAGLLTAPLGLTARSAATGQAGRPSAENAEELDSWGGELPPKMGENGAEPALILAFPVLISVDHECTNSSQ